MEVEALLSTTQLRKLKNTKKFGDWCRYFLDPTNKTTYGNKTQAAMKAYGYNPSTQYNTASCMGYTNYRKLQTLNQHVGASLLEGDGYGFGELLRLGLQKVKSGTYKDWESFMSLLGYFENSVGDIQNLQLSQINFNLADEIKRSRQLRGLE